MLALPLSAAREIVARPIVTPLPTAPPAVLGLFDLRGEIVPLFDVAVLLDAGSVTPDYAAVVECEQGLAGIAASGPLATVTLSDELEPSSHPFVLGTVALPGEADVTVLDLDALLALPAPEPVVPR